MCPMHRSKLRSKFGASNLSQRDLSAAPDAEASALAVARKIAHGLQLASQATAPLCQFLPSLRRETCYVTQTDQNDYLESRDPDCSEYNDGQRRCALNEGP
jgi:hypothetical protein